MLFQSIKAKQEAELTQNCGGEAEMEMSDVEDDSSDADVSSSAKRRRPNPPSSVTAESMLSMAAGI